MEGERDISADVMREIGFLSQRTTSRVVSDEAARGHLDGSTIRLDTHDLPLDERDIPPAFRKRHRGELAPGEEIKKYMEKRLRRLNVLENDPWWKFVELLQGNAVVSLDLIVKPIVEPQLLLPAGLSTGEVLAEVSPYLREEEEEEYRKMMPLPPDTEALIQEVDVVAENMSETLQRMATQPAEDVEEKQREVAAIRKLENRIDLVEKLLQAMAQRLEGLDAADRALAEAIATAMSRAQESVESIKREPPSPGKTEILEGSENDLREAMSKAEEYEGIGTQTTPLYRIQPPSQGPTPLGGRSRRPGGRQSTGTTPIPATTPPSKIRESIYDRMTDDQIIREYWKYIRLRAENPGKEIPIPRTLRERYMKIPPETSRSMFQPSGQPVVNMWNITEDQTTNINPLMMHFTNPEIIGYVHLTPFAKSAIQDALTALRLRVPNLRKVELEHLVKTSGDDVRNLFARLCAQYFKYNRFYSGARQQLASTPAGLSATANNLFTAFKRYIFNPSTQKVERLEEFDPHYSYREKNLNPFAFSPESTQYIPAPTSNLSDWLLPR